jgi:hypothetical protein
MENSFGLLGHGEDPQRKILALVDQLEISQKKIKEAQKKILMKE